MITRTVKAAAARAGLDRAQLAQALGVGTAQAVSNKYTRGSFSARDLVKIATACGYSLAFVGADGRAVVTFDSSDAAPAPAPGKQQ